jgi:hypothetical protein
MLSVRLGQTLENQLNFLAKENNTSKGTRCR